MFRAAVFALGLIFCLLPNSAPAEEYPQCMAEGFLSGFENSVRVRLEPQRCDVVHKTRIRYRGGSAILRVIRPSALPAGDNTAMIRRTNETAVRVGSAIDQMGGNLEVPDITILFTDYVSPYETYPDRIFHKGDNQAETNPNIGNECPMIYYKGPTRGSGDNFVFILSHEIFHCIQNRTWLDMPEEGWLTEGSAEYFAYLAKPDFGSGFIPQFDRAITTTPLNRMDYPAVVFYLWMGSAYGPPRVREFIATAGSIENSVSPDMLMEFAKAYFDQTIRMPDPDGRPLPSSPHTGPIRAVHGSERLTSPTITPYALNSQMRSFDQDKIFRLSPATAPADARTLWRSEPDGSAEVPPASITTCKDAKRYRIIRTTTLSASAGDVDVTAEVAACACPAGNWEETNASIRRTFEQSPFGDTGSRRYIRGRRVLELNPDQTGSFTYYSVETETGRQANPDFWLEQKITGGTRFTWRLVDGMLLTTLLSSNTGGNLVTLHNVQHTSRGDIVKTRQAAPQSIGHVFFCDEAGLHLRQRVRLSGPSFSVDMDFFRIDSASAPGTPPEG